jgi:hypothetical protein
VELRRYGDEGGADGFGQRLGALLAVAFGEGGGPEVDGGSEAGLAQEANEVHQQGLGPPPADGGGGGQCAGAGAVGDRRVVDGEAQGDGGLDERRLEVRHGKAAADAALGEDHHAFAVLEGLLNGSVGARGVGAALAIDEDHLEGFGEPAKDGPGGHVALGDEGGGSGALEDEDVDVAEVVGHEVEGGGGGRPVDLDAHAEDALGAHGPALGESSAGAAGRGRRPPG